MALLKKEKSIKNKIYTLFVVIGTFLIIGGTSIIIYDYLNNKNQEKIENEKVDNFFEIEVNEESPIEEEKQETDIQDDSLDYIAILEIPKINLKRGLYDKNSSKNNVNKNIYFLKETTLPDEQTNSHIILASHSGNSRVAFFNNLKKLKISDEVYFYYKGIKYIYEVSDRYEIEKTGKAFIKNNSTSDITLITCIKNNKQVVYIATLIEKENY